MIAFEVEQDGAVFSLVFPTGDGADPCFLARFLRIAADVVDAVAPAMADDGWSVSVDVPRPFLAATISVHAGSPSDFDRACEIFARVLPGGAVPSSELPS